MGLMHAPCDAVVRHGAAAVAGGSRAVGGKGGRWTALMHQRGHPPSSLATHTPHHSTPHRSSHAYHSSHTALPHRAGCARTHLSDPHARVFMSRQPQQPSASFSPPSLSDLQALAVSLSHAAGALILSAFHSSNKSVSIKTNPLDIVTDTDKTAEALIIAGVRARYPHHRFIAEESHSTPGLYELSEETTWIIDPVDGTNNFVHALPFVCVSIAVMLHRQVQVAVVHAPVLGETFTAIRGQGAHLSHHAVYPSPTTATDAASPSFGTPSGPPERLCVSSITQLSSAAVLTELGYDRSTSGIHRQLERLRLLCTRHSLQSLRSYGSCALNMCYVAAGRGEAYYEGLDSSVGPKPWDSAAAALVLTEAGGLVADTNGGAFDFTLGRVLAANNQSIAAVILDVCKEVEREEAAQLHTQHPHV